MDLLGDLVLSLLQLSWFFLEVSMDLLGDLVFSWPAFFFPVLSSNRNATRNNSGNLRRYLCFDNMFKTWVTTTSSCYAPNCNNNYNTQWFVVAPLRWLVQCKTIPVLQYHITHHNTHNGGKLCHKFLAQIMITANEDWVHIVAWVIKYCVRMAMPTSDMFFNCFTHASH